MMKKSLFQLVFSMALVMGSGTTYSQLFPNGDFELGPGGGCQCPTNFTCGNDAGRVVDGTHPVWGVGNNGCVTGPTNYAPQLGAFGGTSTVYFYAGGDNFDAQPVNFVGGEEVCLSVWYCGPQGAGASGQNTANSHFSFKLDGGQIGPDVLVPTDTPWTEHTFTVIMTAGAHTFGVLSGGAAQYSIWFDNFNADLCTAPSCDPAWTTTTACSADAPINLDALITGDPGGVWSGTGVTGNMFDPSSGTQSITYTNAAPCTDFSTQTITVTTSADASWTAPASVCEADGIVDLAALITGTTGGTWAGTGVTGSNFDPTGLSGAIAITYSVGTAPCDDSNLQNITVVSNPDPAWTPPVGLCSTSPVLDLNTLVTGTAGGVWSGTGVTGSNFDPASGTQSITYTVGMGSCQQISTQDITIGAGGNPAWTTFTMCVSDAPVNLNLSITGDLGGTWTGTGVTGNVFDPFFGTQTVTYTVGSVGCTSLSAQTITVVDPQLTTNNTPVSCFGLSDGTAGVTATGTSGTETYSWNSAPPQNTANTTGLPAGTYTVTVVDGTCTATADVIIIEPTEITGTITGTNGCQPLLGAAAIAVSGGVGGFNYVWNNSPSIMATALDLDSNMHTVTVTDANGCTFIDSVLVQLFPAPTVTTLADTTIIYGNCIPLLGQGASTYTWTPSTDLDCDNCPAPIACPTAATNYCVEGTDVNGCKNSDCVLIDVEIICGDVFVPSAFSPNNDGENELECVYSDCMEYLTFTIYNRWGEKVFETTSMDICWDGTWNGKPLNSAVFVYVLEGRLINGQPVSQKGNISLIR